MSKFTTDFGNLIGRRKLLGNAGIQTEGQVIVLDFGGRPIQEYIRHAFEKETA